MTQDKKWGGDGLNPDDMAIPEIKLIQNVGGGLAKDAGAKPGQFYCSLTDETLDGFDMVVVAMQKNRTYWGRSEIEDEPPECASMNANSMTNINGGDCKNCPYRNEAPWLLPADKRRTMCLVNYNILGINLNNDLPVLVRTTGISAQAAKELYTQISLNKHLASGWFKAKVHVSSVPKKSSAGDAFAIKFGKLELLQDTMQVKELEIRSLQLLGTPIALPNMRDEPEQIPEQIPEKLPATQEVKTQLPATPAKAEKPSEQKEKEPPPDLTEPEIDMNF